MQANKTQSKGRWKLFAIILVCASPLIASYLAYYVIKPQGRTNYGELIDPRNYPMPQMNTTALDGKPASLGNYKGKWIMLQADSGDCAEPCRTKLFQQRQLRLTQGKEMSRIERIWLVTDRQACRHRAAEGISTAPACCAPTRPRSSNGCRSRKAPR